VSVSVPVSSVLAASPGLSEVPLIVTVPLMSWNQPPHTPIPRHIQGQLDPAPEKAISWQ
jgi:hypothetical protein